MENDLIIRSDVIDKVEVINWYHVNADGKLVSGAAEEADAFIHYSDVVEAIEKAPAVDAVGRGVFEQVAWERDIAVGQLSDIGKSFGEKMDDVAKVVRCRECDNWENDWEPIALDPKNPKYLCILCDTFTAGDWFCSAGQRREDGDA